MRIVSMVIGIILLVAGIWVVAGHGSYTITDTVAKIGSVAMKASHQKAIPEWPGIAGIVVGGLVTLGGLFGGRKK